MEFTTGDCPPYFISKSESYLEKTHEQPQKLLVLDPCRTHLMELLTKAAEGFHLGVTLPPGLGELWPVGPLPGMLSQAKLSKDHFQKAIEKAVKIMDSEGTFVA